MTADSQYLKLYYCYISIHLLISLCHCVDIPSQPLFQSFFFVFFFSRINEYQLVMLCLIHTSMKAVCDIIPACANVATMAPPHANTPQSLSHLVTNLSAMILRMTWHQYRKLKVWQQDSGRLPPPHESPFLLFFHLYLALFLLYRKGKWKAKQ